MMDHDGQDDALLDEDLIDDEDSLDDDDDLDGGVIPDDYDDFDDDEDDPDFDDDFDDYEDASLEDLDFVAALYREDGQPVVYELNLSAANDLEEMIDQLRRLPGDAGAIGAVSIAGEFFVLCRVRGRNVQVLLNDSLAALDWPIARDVLDFLGLDVPEEDDDDELIGDTEILVDQGLSEFDMEQIAGDLDEDSDQLVLQIVDHINFGPAFRKEISVD